MPENTIDDIWSLDGLDALAGQTEPYRTRVVAVPRNGNGNTGWAPDILMDLLFQQETAGYRTYLLVDPTLRTEITGLFDLDVVDVPVACLFNGDAAKEQEEVAPYLVDMTLEGETVSLFNREFFKRHWGQGTGVFLTSTATLAELKRHLRKFTKLKREKDDRWFVFRFWDPAIASVYFRTIEENQLRASQWFGRGLIDKLFIEENDGQSVSIFDGAAREGFADNAPLPPVVLTEYELEPFRETALKRHIKEMATLLTSDFSAELKSHSAESVARHISPAVTRFMNYGFKRRENLHVIAAWALFFGPEFDDKDPEGRLQAICASGEPETNRFKALKDRMAELGTKKVKT